MTRKQVLLIGLLLSLSIMFLGLGFADFSSNLSIDDIEVALRMEKDIRITDFYPINGIDDASSYNVSSVHSKIYLPNPNSEVTYNVEVTNISTYALQIDDIKVLPNNLTYTITNYELGDNICDTTKTTNECIMGVKKNFLITFKYKEDGYDSSNTSGEYLVDTNFNWGYNYKVRFHSNTNEDLTIIQSLPYDTNYPLRLNSFTNSGYAFSKWNTSPDGTGTSYKNGASVRNLSTNGRIIDLYAQWTETSYEINYEGECIFNGKNNDVIGECAEGNHIDFINTNITPFTQEDHARSFIFTFTITDLPDETLSSSDRDTIINAVYENSDNIAGKWPGFNLRIENGKLQMQGGDGRTTSTKKQFTKAELLNKEIKIIRHNDGNTIKLYYMIGNNGPFLLKDVTTLYNYFNTPLTLGAIVEIDNVTESRHSKVTLSDISFEYIDEIVTLEELIEEEEEEDPNFPTVFEVEGPCIFNGTNNITGDQCQDYHNVNYIDTNIALFSSTNASKDFELSFKIDSFSTTQPDAQSTIMNAFREVSPKGYGVLMRKSSQKIEFIERNDLLVEKKLYYNTVTNVSIIRKNDHICYKIDNLDYVYGGDFSSFTHFFDVPVTFGASINSSGDPFRYINGTLSNMKIKLGTNSDPNIVCEP